MLHTITEVGISFLKSIKALKVKYHYSLNERGNDYNCFLLNRIFFLDSDLKVRDDQKIQAFREELVRPRSMNEGGGCGMNVYHFTFGFISVGFIGILHFFVKLIKKPNNKALFINILKR